MAAAQRFYKLKHYHTHVLAFYCKYRGHASWITPQLKVTKRL